MALAEKSEAEEPPSPEEAGWVVKKKVISCFKGVRLLKTLIIVVCTIVVLHQISACIRKLIDIPVTTYTHFDFNKTIAYPSVTFCREPAYKYDRMMAYRLYSHPRFTSEWINYNFSISLDDLWEDITYNEQDIFVQFGLGGSTEDVDLHPTMGFVLGRCYTMTPKTLGSRASKSSGYSITLRHSAADIATISGVDPPGYHVYVHYTREPFTEVEVYNGGLVQNLFVNVGETIDVKLTVDEYLKISREDLCTYEEDYSANLCTAQFVWDTVGQQAGCSGPWMVSDLPPCANYTDMRNLITAYMNTYEHHRFDSCPRFCRSYLYNCFVTDRQTLYTWDTAVKRWCMKTSETALQTQLYIYFNSMMVSVYEERYNYDWNLFISDLGGSIRTSDGGCTHSSRASRRESRPMMFSARAYVYTLVFSFVRKVSMTMDVEIVAAVCLCAGFLLGLSVIGLIQILGKTWDQFIRPFVKTSTRTAGITGSTITADVETTTVKHPGKAEEENARKKTSN